MARNLNLLAGLCSSTMAVFTGFQPDLTLANPVNPAEIQATRSIKPVEAIDRYQQGLTAVVAGDLTQAMNNFNRAIELDSQYFQAYIERGNVKDAIRDFPGAIADYTTAISLNPKAAAAYYNRGTMSSKSGRHRSAISDYTRAIEIDPQYAQAYLNRGNELDDLGDTTAALNNYDRAIKIRPNYALAYLNRGIAHERAGNRTRAIADLQQAAKLFKAVGNLDRYHRTIELIENIQPEV